MSELIIAAKENDIAKVELLIKEGCYLNGTDKKGNTALHFAAMYGWPRIADHLLGAGATIDKFNNDKYTPLLCSVKSSKCTDNGMLAKLIALGANVNLKMDQDFTPLMEAAKFNELMALKLLIKAGADVNAQNFKGWTALRLAASFGHIDAVEVLLYAGADPSLLDEQGLTIYSHIGRKNREEIQSLLKRYEK